MDTDSSFYQNLNSDQSEKHCTQKDFYPSFAKKPQKPSHQKTISQNGQDQSDWSLASIKSPKIKSNEDTIQNDHSDQFFLGGNLNKKVKIIRKRSSKLSNTTEDEDEINKGLNSQTDTLKANISQKRMNHLLSNIQGFKQRGEHKKEGSLEQRLIGKEEGSQIQNRSDSEQKNLLKDITSLQRESPQKNSKEIIPKQGNLLYPRKDSIPENSSALNKQTDSSSQLQKASIIRPNSAHKNNENTGSPKKYGNIPKPPSPKKQEKKEFQEPIKLQLNECTPSKAPQKTMMGAYLKQLYDFSQNKEMNDENHLENEQDDCDAYKVILEDKPKNNGSSAYNYRPEIKINLECKLSNEITKPENISTLQQHQQLQQLQSEKETNKLIRGNEKSLSPLKNQTNKFQSQINQNHTEKPSYQLNEQKQINQKNQTNLPLPPSSPPVNQESNKYNIRLIQDNISSADYSQDEKHTKTSSQLQSKQQPQKQIKIESAQQSNLMDINKQDNNQSQQSLKIKSNTNHTLHPSEVKNQDSLLKPVEYHDFDNSFDDEGMAQIQKIDTIIKQIEQTTNNLVEHDDREPNNPSQKKIKVDTRNESPNSKQNQNLETLKIPQETMDKDKLNQSVSDQNIEESNNLDDSFEFKDNGDNFINIPQNNINYDWGSMKEPNYKPSTSPLKERLYAVENEAENNEGEHSNNNKNKEADSLMIVMVNKNQSTVQKKKEVPTLRQRDVFSDEFWNPVTQPKNYKVTHQPPNLNEERHKQKQMLVPVKVSFEEDKSDQKQINSQKQKAEDSKLDHSKGNSNIVHNKNEAKPANLYGYVEETSMFDEVKDFFKPQHKTSSFEPHNRDKSNSHSSTYNNDSNQNSNNTNNKNNNNNINNNKINNQNNQSKISMKNNDYDDWDDYYK